MSVAARRLLRPFFWSEGRHCQFETTHVDVWVGIRSRSWIVGVQASLHDPDDRSGFSLAVMVGPFYAGTAVTW